MPDDRRLKAKRETRRARGSLDRQQIIDNAFELARISSVDDISMPALARYIGVGVTSIYWHFRSKDEFMDAMILEGFNRFYQMIPWTDDGDWRDGLRQYFTSFRRCLVDNPVVADLVVGRIRPNGTPEWEETAKLIAAHMDHEIGRLIIAGMSPERAWRAYAMLSTYVKGCIRNTRLCDTKEDTTRHQWVHQRMSWPHDLSNFPYLVSVVPVAMPSMATDEDFHFALNLIIDGLEHHLEEAPPVNLWTPVGRVLPGRMDGQHWTSTKHGF